MLVRLQSIARQMLVAARHAVTGMTGQEAAAAAEAAAANARALQRLDEENVRIRADIVRWRARSVDAAAQQHAT